MFGRTALLAVVFVSALVPSLPAQRKPVGDRFDVVQIGEERRVVASSEVPTLKKQLAEEAKSAVKEWTAAKAAARKAREKFTTPRPKARKLQVIKRGLAKSEADAVASGARTSGARSAPRSSGRWLVVAVGDSHRVVQASARAGLQKEVVLENKKALADWNQARKDAVKSKEKFTTPRPKPVAVKTVGKPFKSEDEARAFLATLKSD